MIPQVTIRKAEPQDRVDVEVLMSTYFHGVEGIPIENFMVAVIDSMIIGAAYLKTGTFPELHSIAVHPDHRGRGIGRLLMDALIVDMEEGFIFTRTTSPVFFEKVGFIRLDDSQKKELWDECTNCNRFNKCKQSVLRLEINKR